MAAQGTNDRHGVEDAVARSPAGEAFNRVLLQVLNLNGRFTAAGEDLAGTAGQTLARWVVMAQCMDSPASVSHIARQLGLARQSVQRIADVLVRDALCVYVENPHHQRAKLLQLTPSGRSVFVQIDRAQRRWCNALGEEVGEDVLHRAASALDTVAQAVDRWQERVGGATD